MKIFVLPAVLCLFTLTAAPVFGQTDMYHFNPNYNFGGGNLRFNAGGNDGNNFQLLSSQVPAGDTVEVTALGFWAGTPGIAGSAWSTAGTVVQNHTLSLWGPNTSQGGSFSGLSLASVTLNAGAAVDADGFAWVDLSSPIALVPGDYYLLTASFSSTGANGTADPLINPYDSNSPQDASITPDANGVITGTPFYVAQGAYNTTGGYAYTWSTYLGPNLQFQMVPEPTVLTLFAGAWAAGWIARRRVAKV